MLVLRAAIVLHGHDPIRFGSQAATGYEEIPTALTRWIARHVSFSQQRDWYLVSNLGVSLQGIWYLYAENGTKPDLVNIFSDQVTDYNLYIR